MIPRRPARAPGRACGPRFPRGWFARTAPALAPPADSGSGRSTRRCALGLEAPEPGLELIEVALVLHRGPDPRAGAAGRTRGRRAAFGRRRATHLGSGNGRPAEELVEREPAGRGRRNRRCRLLWRRARLRRHRAGGPLLAEPCVEREPA